jgi:hypothetical protein
VPKRRGKGRSYGTGEADGGGVGGVGGIGVGTLATVTVICAGLMVTTLMPAGTTTVMFTVCVPTSRLLTDTAPTRVDVSKALRAAVAPLRVTMTLGVERV